MRRSAAAPQPGQAELFRPGTEPALEPEAKGALLRDAAMLTVLVNAGQAWREQAYHMALRAFAEFPEGAIFETVRLWCEEHGLPRPHHHNAWGAVANILIREGRVEETGRLEKSRSAKAHARRQPIWRLSRKGNP